MTTAALTLGEALGNLYADGSRPPCHGSDLWTSEDAGDRRIAADLCPGCPVAAECLAAAVTTGEVFGVWAGHDLGSPEGRRAAHRQAGPITPAPTPTTCTTPGCGRPVHVLSTGECSAHYTARRRRARAA